MESSFIEPGPEDLGMDLSERQNPFVAKPSTPYSRPVGVNEKKLPPLIHVRYLYQPGELEGGKSTRLLKI